MCVSINGPGDPDLWPFDLETGTQVASIRWGTFLPNLGMLVARPFDSWIIRYVRDWRTDRQTDGRMDKSNAYCPFPIRRRVHWFACVIQMWRHCRRINRRRLIYLARTSFPGAGRSTACGNRSREATVCRQCRALMISSAAAPACRPVFARVLCQSISGANCSQSKRLQISGSRYRFVFRRSRSCSGALPSRGGDQRNWVDFRWCWRVTPTGSCWTESVVVGRRHVQTVRPTRDRRTDGRTYGRT